MSWVATAVVGVAAVGSYSQSTAAGDAAKKSRRATGKSANEAEALNRERFEEARGLMTPYIGRSEIASQQLMAEMGLPQYEVPIEQQGEDEPAADPAANQVNQQFQARDLTQLPGYENLMGESLRAAEQSAATSGSTAYGGRRLKEAGKVGAGVQQSYYSNYMNMLQNLSSPTTATNLAGMGIGQAQSIGSQNIAATNAQNDYRLMGTKASNAAIADFSGAATNVGKRFI